MAFTVADGGTAPRTTTNLTGVRSSPLKKERATRFGPCWPCLWRGSTCRRPLRRLAESDGKMIAGEERSWGRHPGRGAGVSITEIRSPIRAGLRKGHPLRVVEFGAGDLRSSLARWISLVSCWDRRFGPLPSVAL